MRIRYGGKNDSKNHLGTILEGARISLSSPLSLSIFVSLSLYLFPYISLSLYLLTGMDSNWSDDRDQLISKLRAGRLHVHFLLAEIPLLQRKICHVFDTTKCGVLREREREKREREKVKEREREREREGERERE
eukprot:sb/3474791/